MSNEEKEDLLYVICDTSRDNDLVRKAYDYINKLEKKNKKLKEDLRVSQSNEETYSLEMQEITKIVGFDEDTLFDDVKECVKLLNEEHNKKLRVFMAYNSYHSILKDLEEWLKEPEYFNGRKLRQDYITVMTTDVLDKIQELKEEYK